MMCSKNNIKNQLRQKEMFISIIANLLGEISFKQLKCLSTFIMTVLLFVCIRKKKKHIFLQSSLGIQWVSMGMMLSLEPSWHYLEVVGADNQEGWAPADRRQRSCSTPNSVQVGPTTKDYPAQTYNQGFLSQVPNEHLLKAAP